MGSIEKATKKAWLLVAGWEGECIGNTELDGPLSNCARKTLVSIIAESLTTHVEVVQGEAEPSPRKRGRPPKCQSMP